MKTTINTLARQHTTDGSFLGKTAAKGFYAIKAILDGEHGTIDWDVFLPKRQINLQRGFVWCAEQKNDFLMKFFSASPLLQYAPPIIVREIVANSGSGESTAIIIDGKQRLRALYDFYIGNFMLTIGGKTYSREDHPIQATQCAVLNIVFTHVFAKGTVKEWIAENEEELCRQFSYVNMSSVPQDLAHLAKLK